MTSYLRHAAERGAGSRTGQIVPAVPSRFAQPYDVPTIVTQPARATLMSDLPFETPHIEREPAADESSPAARTVEVLPATEKNARPPVTPPVPASPAPSQPESTRRADAPIRAIAEGPGERREPALTRAVADRARVGTQPGNAQPPSLSITAPPVRVRLDPSPPPEPPRNDVRSTAILPAGDAPIGMGSRPLLVRERLAPAAPRNDVRVSIGRIDVRVEAPPPPTPKSDRAVEPSDPFVSLSLARRGWRAPF